jgi:hypothetical protein
MIIGNNKNAQVTGAGAVMISKDEMRSLREKAVTGAKTEAVVITKTDLDRMRGAAVIVSND